MARPFLILDLSNNNGAADLTRIRQAGIVGFWHKVSEGTTFTDQRWAGRARAARAMGLRVGGYHFASPHPFSVRAEAQAFVARLGKIERRDLCPVLDLESNPHGLHTRELVNWARAFNHEVEKLTGVWPLFYSYPSFIESLRAETSLGRGLWLASYSRNDGREHPFSVPHPFHKALAHQFTSRARVAGVDGAADLSSAPRLVPILANGWRGL